jgi:hypothetical protein
VCLAVLSARVTARHVFFLLDSDVVAHIKEIETRALRLRHIERWAGASFRAGCLALAIITRAEGELQVLEREGVSMTERIETYRGTIKRSTAMSNKSIPTIATAAPDPLQNCRLTEVSQLITEQPMHFTRMQSLPHRPKHNPPASSATI